MSKFTLPRSVLTQNTHRIVLHLDQSPRDSAERAMLIATDGLGAARRALAGLDELAPEILRANRAAFEGLRKQIRERAIFAPLFQDCAVDALVALDGWLARHGEDEEVVQVRGVLADAMEASEQVADFAAARRAIAVAR